MIRCLGEGEPHGHYTTRISTVAPGNRRRSCKMGYETLETGRGAAMTSTTEITLVTGHRHRVAGELKDVERKILDAARGSIMQLAWLVDAETGGELAVNPDHVVTLRAVDH